jgi:hypothetical protein
LATWHFTFYGLMVELDHAEVDQIIRVMNSTSAGGHVIGGILNHISPSGPAEHVAIVLSALVGLGANTLDRCNSNRQGIELHVTWRRGWWCLPR